MDTLRSQFSGHEEWTDRPDFDVQDDDTGREPPPPPVGQDERRMQVRAYNFWAGLLDGRNFPSVEDFDPDHLPDFGPYSVLLDFTCGIENPSVQFLGSRLAEECGAAGPILTLADVPSRSLLSRITDHYMQILANQAPIGFEAEFVSHADAVVLYRGILLPFSSDDDTIDFIYGVINWKELADQRTADELLLEIDQALEAGPDIVRKEQPMAEWADGPADNGPGVLDLNLADSLHEPEVAEIALPEPAFLAPPESDAPAPIAPTDDFGLADWLQSARDLAQAADASEDRTRAALYAAIGRAHDFALAANDSPEDLAMLLEDAGIVAQERAPLVAIAKLVFGATYDKTRLTEYATALDHAQRNGIAREEFAAYLGALPGGLKALVKAERARKRGENPAPSRTAPKPGLARKLRKLAPLAMSDLNVHGEEFTLLVARRTTHGEIELLGEVDGDLALFERVARKLVN